MVKVDIQAPGMSAGVYPDDGEGGPIRLTVEDGGRPATLDLSIVAAEKVREHLDMAVRQAQAVAALTS
jgi:hypothetical protein